jgi:hypothetical protein
MVTLLITSFLILAGITYAIYIWQRPSIERDTEFELPPAPPRFQGLFDDSEEMRALALHSAEAERAEQRRILLERAHAGDKHVLPDASGDETLYDEVLNALTERADTDQKLLALVSHIARSDQRLRVNKSLAEKFIVNWKQNPDRNSTAKMLHIAALSDDASVYQTAIESVFQFWREGRVQQISAAELRSLIESEFWLLTAGARASGAGFVLKRKLAAITRQLASNDG